MIFEDYWFYQLELACITAGIEVGLFTELDDQKRSVLDLSKSLKLFPHALEPLLLNLTQLGFIQKEGDLFSCTQESKILLNSKSEFYRGDYFVESELSAIEERLIEFLKTGSAPLLASGKSFSDMWEKGQMNQTVANGFTGNMHSLMKYTSSLNAKSEEFSKCRELVDVGGGSGAWALALTKIHPDLNVTIFDLPPVLNAAKDILAKEKHEHSSRIKFHSGNFFNGELPTTADSFLLSNILHDWPVPQCKNLLQQISNALPSGGKLFIHECLLNPDKTSPKFSVLFHLLMAMNHHAQQFTKDELDELLEFTGFLKSNLLSVNRNYSLLLAVKK
jgi:acetylserotonin N-methyltransferase